MSKATNATATKCSPITTSKPPQTLATPTKTVSGSITNQTPTTNTTPNTPGPAPVVSPSPLQVNLANVDLGKISSILSSLSNAMKTTGEFSLAMFFVFVLYIFICIIFCYKIDKCITNTLGIKGS